MDPTSFSQNPFAVLTFIAAPAILTSATSVLAMSTINRMLRVRERMHQLLTESEDATLYRGMNFLELVNRVEQQGVLLLRAMRWVYVALGSFAAATLVTLLGAVAGQLGSELLLHTVIGMGLLLGCTGVAGLIGGCVNLFHATELSLVNIRKEAESLRQRQAFKKSDAEV
ncbi:MAG: DUF2721 domain-containing protein [Verrucomicrobiota bacterium]